MRGRITVLLFFLATLSAACGWTTAPLAPTPFPSAYVLVTVDVNASPTPTPFQPVREPLPTATLALPASTSTATPPPTPTPTPTPAAGLRPRYTLLVNLDYEAHRLAVDETIVYPNAGGETLDRLRLAVEPNRWPGCFALTGLTVNDQAVTDSVLSGGWLEVPLGASLAPGETVTLKLLYTLSMPWAGPQQIFGYNDRQLNAVDWYPFVVPYVAGRGWVNHEPTTVGEHLVYDVADFEVTIHLTGSVTSGLVIAASAPAEGERYRLTGARNFAFSVSPDFQSRSTTAAGVTITSYYFESEAYAGDALLGPIARALTTYGQRFAPYPYPSLSIVEADYPDGLEHCGLFFLSRRFYTDYDGGMLNDLIVIGVHETAHNWWYGLVGNDQALEPWLDEALATYSEYVFYSDNYPGLTNGWWDSRVNAFQPGGWVDVTIYNGGEFRPYTNAVYLQGARFLHALRQRMGDAAFFAFLRAYAAQLAYRRASAADFFALARQYSTTDFSDLVGAYFQNAP